MIDVQLLNWKPFTFLLLIYLQQYCVEIHSDLLYIDIPPKLPPRSDSQERDDAGMQLFALFVRLLWGRWKEYK